MKREENEGNQMLCGSSGYIMQAPSKGSGAGSWVLMHDEAYSRVHDKNKHKYTEITVYVVPISTAISLCLSCISAIEFSSATRVIAGPYVSTMNPSLLMAIFPFLNFSFLFLFLSVRYN